MTTGPSIRETSTPGEGLPGAIGAPAGVLNSSPVTPRRSRLARIALLLSAVAIGLAIGECAVRMLNLAPIVFPVWVTKQRTAYRRSKNPILGYELKPDYRDPQADTHESVPATNAFGQRDIERQLAKPAGVRRILILGDSVAVGAGVYSLDDTISRQMEVQLDDRRIEVLNFGVSGYCTRAEVELLRTKGLDFRPDLVIVLFVGNDYSDTNVRVHQYGSIYERPEFVKHLFVRSALFRLAALKLNLFHFGDEVDPQTWHSGALGTNNVETGLAELMRLSREHRFHVLLALWPGFADNFISDLWIEPNVPDPLRIRRIAKKLDIPIVELADYFRKDWRMLPAGINPRVQYSIGDTLHPSRIGARVGASALCDYLDKHPELLEPINSEAKAQKARN